MLVVPETPSGSPAVMTARSPYSTNPFFTARLIACLKRSSDVVCSSIDIGATPHESASCLQTFSHGEQPIICVTGRKRLIILAVFPDFVTVMMAFAPRSCAVVQAAWEMAVVTFEKPESWFCLKRSM